MGLGGRVEVAGALINRVVPLVKVDPVFTPTSVGDIPVWLKAAAPFIKALGGHPDDALTGQLLLALEHAKITKDVDLATRQYRHANWPLLWRGVKDVLLGNAFGLRHIHGTLYQRALHPDGSLLLAYTLCGMRAVTDVGVAAIVDAWQNTFELENFNFHGCGTGVTAESAAQTALVTEITTGLNPDSTRATGTRSEPSANVLRSVGTNTFDGAFAVTEHGLFSQAATGGGVMYDRTVFGAINVVAAGAIEHTWDATFPSAG